jgi:hypothetical protein
MPDRDGKKRVRVVSTPAQHAAYRMFRRSVIALIKKGERVERLTGMTLQKAINLVAKEADN